MVADLKFFRLSFVYIFYLLLGSVVHPDYGWGGGVVLITGNPDNLKGNFVL
jgi:hypothetical protein